MWHTRNPAGEFPVIPAPRNPRQYRALGLVQGHLKPGKSYGQATLITPTGDEYATTLGRVELLPRFNECLHDPDTDYWFYVHPQPRREGLGLSVTKIMVPLEGEPLEGFLIADGDLESVFNIRGDVEIQDENIVVTVKRKPIGDRVVAPLQIAIEGYLPSATGFWDLWAEIQGQTLQLVDGNPV